MSDLRTERGTVPSPRNGFALSRETRRMLLPMLGGLIVAVYILAPFCWLLLTSFMHEQDALSVPPQWIPRNPTLSNYMTFIDPAGTRAIVGSRAAEQTFPGMVNSLLAATGTALLNLVLGTLAGYALARFRFPGRGSLLGLYLGSRLLPGIALIVPLYLTIKNFGLLDHLSALIVTYVSFTLPFTIWLLKNYFQTIPRSLEEAAFMDGCTWFGVFWRIVLPLSKPAVVSLLIFDGVATWNEFILAQIFLRANTNRTLPLGVVNFQTEYATAYELLAAAQCITIAPLIIVYLVFQRHFVDGLSGSVKS